MVIALIIWYFSFIVEKTTCYYVEVNRSYSYFPNIVVLIWRGTTYNHVSNIVLFQNRHNVQYIAFLSIYSSVFYSLKGSIENRFFKFFAYIFFLNADFNIFT